MKNIVILGSTGSIGKSSLDVISRFPEKFKVIGLTAGKNTDLLIKQIEQFNPIVVAVSNEDSYKSLKSKIKDSKIKTKNLEILVGQEGIISVAKMQEADIVLSAIVGAAGLLPTIASIQTAKTVAIANKETLVMAGDYVMSEVNRCGTLLIPVDSEHSAIFQCINEHNRSFVKKIILTASGGPFFGKRAKELENISPEDALKHPNWSMGKKITIDSATLMNKGLEMIEAHHLFNTPPENIDVLIHPQSIIHSIVEFNDCSYLAQLSRPDMKGPIAYALSYPERLNDVIKPINWESLSSKIATGLTFYKPDTKTFPCLPLSYSAIKIGKTMPAVLNASNEVAVGAFLEGIIGFNKIPVIINKVMDLHTPQPADDIYNILEADRWARDATLKIIRSIKK